MRLHSMSTFEVKAKVWKVGAAETPIEVDLAVDTGATYTTLPTSMLRRMKIHPLRRARLRIADGRIVQRGLGEVGIELQGRRSSATPVIFGTEGVRLLGAVTLETLSFAVDSVKEKLTPTGALLLVSRNG